MCGVTYVCMFAHMCMERVPCLCTCIDNVEAGISIRYLPLLFSTFSLTFNFYFIIAVYMMWGQGARVSHDIEQCLTICSLLSPWALELNVAAFLSL